MEPIVKNIVDSLSIEEKARLVCGETFFAEHGVRLVEFKECAGGDSDHQFVFYSECHF